MNVKIRLPTTVMNKLLATIQLAHITVLVIQDTLVMERNVEASVEIINMTITFHNDELVFFRIRCSKFTDYKNENSF